MYRSASTLVLLLLLATPLAVFAQSTGKVAGVVTDVDGAPLPGANVVIDGTTLGAATNLDGEYNILGVPVGIYDITASFVGYDNVTYSDVEVNSGFTRTLNFEMRENTELGEVVVEYERPIIQNDAIGAPKVVTGEDIENLPVRGVTSVTAIQGGVVSQETSSELNVRGGRSEEVQYFVDGVKVSGAGNVGVNQQAIAEQEMLIGTIPARYGDVQSGVISITTKSGAPSYFGSAEFITSEGLDGFGYNLASLSIGGPIVPNKPEVASFFISGEGIFQSDSSPYGVETYRLTDSAFDNLLANPQVLAYENAAGDRQYLPFPWEALEGQNNITSEMVLGALDTTVVNQLVADGYELESFLPINAPETYTASDFDLAKDKDDPFNQLTFNGNINFNVTNTTSLRVGGGYQADRAEEYTFANSLYNRNFFYNDERDYWRVYGTLRQRFSNGAFVQVQGEFQDFQFVQYPEGFSSDPEDSFFYGDIDTGYNELSRRYYAVGSLLDEDGDGSADGATYVQQFLQDGSSRPGTVAAAFSLPGAPLSVFQQSHNQSFRLSASGTAQLGVHQLEIGGEFERETRRFYYNFARNLSQAYADGDVEAAGAVPGLPDNGVLDYEDIPFEAFPDFGLATTSLYYYGYNYLGTEEVDDQNIDAFRDGTNNNIAPYEPIYYAGYIQDKIEFRDLVISLGLRVDVFDNNVQVLRDVYAPVPIVRAGTIADRPSGIDSDFAVYFNDADVVVGYRDLDGNFFDATGQSVLEDDVTGAASGQVQETDEPLSAAFTDYDPEVTVMPRLGVSFPVTDRALFFANYSVLSQRPTERAFAPFPAFFGLQSQDSRVPNPTLEPEKTTQYELGYRQRLGERAALTLSGFYRTQENKISNRPVQGGFPTYGSYFNQDFTTTKGLELGFDLRRTNNLSVNANYTLSFAEGTGSDAAATANIVWRGDFFPNFISPAEFDQRHSFNMTVDYRLGEDEGPMLFGSHVLQNFGVNVLGVFGSGFRYTAIAGPRQAGESFTDDVVGNINEQTLPATTRIDLRVDRSFNLGFGDASLRAYLWVQNLLDTENTLAVYRATGVADQDGYLTDEVSRTFRDNAPDLEGRIFNYSAYTQGPVNVGGNQSSTNGLFYTFPRRVRLGLLFSF